MNFTTVLGRRSLPRDRLPLYSRSEVIIRYLELRQVCPRIVSANLGLKDLTWALSVMTIEMALRTIDYDRRSALLTMFTMDVGPVSETYLIHRERS